MSRSSALPAALVALVLTLPAADAAARDLTGSAGYRERIALPPDAVLVVEARGRDGIVGEARIPADGRQVPIDWKLSGMPSEEILLRAAIEVGGELRWLGEPVMVAAGGDDLAVPPLMLAQHVFSGFASTLACGPEVVRLGFVQDGAVIFYGGETRRLAPVEAASGAKYSDGSAEGGETWAWTKGDTALVRWSGGDLPPCRALPLPEDRPFVARGNEPFWRLDMGADGLVMTTPEGEAARAAALPPPVFGTQSVIYMVPGGPRVEIRPGICQDSMTGMPYPATVILNGETDGERRMGCGGEPADLLQGGWTAVELDGAALAEGIEVTLEFAGDRVAGRAACNRYNGGFTLTGEGLSFGPAAVTQMACPEDRMQAQAAFFAALEATDRFEIDGSGDLLLIGGDRRLLRARR